MINKQLKKVLGHFYINFASEETFAQWAIKIKQSSSVCTHMFIGIVVFCVLATKRKWIIRTTITVSKVNRKKSLINIFSATMMH